MDNAAKESLKEDNVWELCRYQNRGTTNNNIIHLNISNLLESTKLSGNCLAALDVINSPNCCLAPFSHLLCT